MNAYKLMLNAEVSNGINSDAKQCILKDLQYEYLAVPNQYIESFQRRSSTKRDRRLKRYDGVLENL